MRNHGPTGPTSTFSDGRIAALDNRIFKNQAALDKHWDLLERIAGRELNYRELMQPYGLHQSTFDALSLRDKAQDFKFYPKMIEVEADSGNPFESAHVRELVQRQEQHFTGRADRKQIYEQAAKEWNEKEQAEEKQKAEQVERQPMIDVARALADRLRFDPAAPLDDVRESIRAVKQAETLGACLDTAKQMIADGLDAETARAETKSKALQAKLNEIKQTMVERPGTEPEPPAKTPEPPAPKPEPPKIEQDGFKPHEERAAEERLDKMFASCERPGAVHAWPEMTAPGVTAEQRYLMAQTNEAASNEAAAKGATE